MQMLSFKIRPHFFVWMSVFETKFGLQPTVGLVVLDEPNVGNVFCFILLLPDFIDHLRLMVKKGEDTAVNDDIKQSSFFFPIIVNHSNHTRSLSIQS